MKWSASELAARSVVSLPTIQRLEKTDGVPPSRSSTLMEIQAVFEAAGVEFIGAPDDRPGIRVATKPKYAEQQHG